jgi:hypothetical protein
MKKKSAIKYSSIFLIAIFFMACKRPFEATIPINDTKFLIIGGVINTAPNSVTNIYLSKTKPLNDTTINYPENGAIISIESKTGSSYLLREQSELGKYSSDNITLNVTDEFRLSIMTSDGKKYQSAYVKSKQTPAIDSVTFEQNPKDVLIKVNTNDPTGNTRYYQWDFDEAYEYKSIYQTNYAVQNGLIYLKAPQDQTDTCWLYKKSGFVLIGSSTNLSNDIISNQPLLTIPYKDDRLNYRYAITVRQYAITAEAHKYWDVIKKNSQQLGTLFDRQPSQLFGTNFICLTNPDEIVVGFASAAYQQEFRLFIRNRDLADWPLDPAFNFSCADEYALQDPNNFAIFPSTDTSLSIYYFVTPGGMFIAKKKCLDCRYQGGTNKRPSFW